MSLSTPRTWALFAGCLAVAVATFGCGETEQSEEDAGSVDVGAVDGGNGAWTACECADDAGVPDGSGEAPVNLLSNPSFERDAPTEGCPPAWTCVTYQPPGAGAFAAVGTGARDGDATVRWAAEETSSPVVKQRVDAAPDRRYEVSVWVRGERLESTPFLQILFDDDEEQLLDDQIFRAAETSGDWVKITGSTRPAPAGTDSLRVNLAADGVSGPIWWDHASLRQMDDPGMGDDVGTDAGPDSGPVEEPSKAERIGGGAAYVAHLRARGEPTFCNASSGDHVVRNATVSALVGALESASSGDVVWVSGELEIDMGFDASVDIPAGVTLASDRGCDGAEGARLYTDDKPEEDYNRRQMFHLTNDDARISGLRLEGPYQTKDALHSLEYLENRGVVADGIEGVELDNVEMFNFMTAAVRSEGGVVHVHHSSIHHNNQNGWGYGISAPEWGSVIEYNRFDYNRHAIAGTGASGQGYIARFNIFGDTCLNSQQRMDQHGHPDDGDTAGRKMEIYRNTVRDPSCVALGIRGEPEEVTPIHHNWFEHSQGNAMSLGDDDNLGKSHSAFDVHDNSYGPGEPPCDIGAPRSSCE